MGISICGPKNLTSQWHRLPFGRIIGDLCEYAQHSWMVANWQNWQNSRKHLFSANFQIFRGSRSRSRYSCQNSLAYGTWGPCGAQSKFWHQPLRISWKWGQVFWGWVAIKLLGASARGCLVHKRKPPTQNAGITYFCTGSVEKWEIWNFCTLAQLWGSLVRNSCNLSKYFLTLNVYHR